MNQGIPELETCWHGIIVVLKCSGTELFVLGGHPRNYVASFFLGAGGNWAYRIPYVFSTIVRYRFPFRSLFPAQVTQVTLRLCFR